ncbi:phosphatidylserine decarboxylase [Aliidiomarina iranensis]|uniref:Phosphatidylserine decarboxylase proenzyme n=1 Tax=Aliidiomarina iranensis TaxID=1434071 RepID=A0A432VRV5_9GAMM|nr:archaetidylserine decarboxylase [Aliidiomarina iranensis]RUO19023.1 phosphatidylserine decarboxylase [Aliidiomarina iranensis]
MANFDRLKITLQYITPKHLISRAMGKFASAEAGWFTRAFTQWFIKRYNVDMSEAAESDPRAYATFNAFFTRPLRADARPLEAAEGELAHPVDGAVSQLGSIKGDTIIQAKNHDYSMQELLGGDYDLAKEFTNGSFATIYLAPRDYHRIHMPLKGTLRQMIYVPGDLFSVNPFTAENVPNLFARNERVIAVFDSEKGPFAMVLVGATIVASIETIWAGTVTPPRGPGIHSWDYPASGLNSIKLDIGEEMGRFKLGSTVILVFPEDMMEFAANLEPQTVTRMGTVMGTLK